MFRSTITLSTLALVISSTIVAPLHACGSRSRRTVYSRPRTVRVVRPVQVVRPTVVVRRAVAPALVPPPKQLPTVPAGSAMTLPANFLGNEQGSAFMVFGKIKLPVEIRQWSMTGVTIALPPMAIKDAVVVRIDVVLPSGKLGHSQELRVTAPAPLVVHAVSPTSPLPTQSALTVNRGPARPALVQPALNPSSPIVLPGPAVQTAAPQTGTPQQPIVLPAASLANTQPATAQRPAAPTAPAALQGQGTTAEPFVLPPAQPANTANAATTATSVSETTSTEPTQDESEDWLRNNPILMEGLNIDTPADSEPLEQPAETLPEQAPSTEAVPPETQATGQPATRPSVATISNAASIFATVAKTLLAN